MSFKFRSSPWFSIRLLTVVIACVAFMGCGSESKQARPPENLNSPLQKAPEMARGRSTGGGNASQSTQPSGGGGSSASPLQKAPGTTKSKASPNAASSGGAKSKKGF